MLHATTACTFSISQLPKVVAALAGLIFDVAGPQVIEKRIRASRPLRTPTFFFFPLVLFSDLPTSFFSSLTLPTSAFPSVHILRSLTSKLPSVPVLTWSTLYT